MALYCHTTDERLPLGPLDATTRGMLLEKERDLRGELERENSDLHR